MPNDYPDLDIRRMRIHIIEASSKVLGAMSEKASLKAQKYLEDFRNLMELNEEQIQKLEQHIIALCPKVPQQNDGASCGMFLLEYIERILVDTDYVEKIAKGDSDEENDPWFLADDVNGEEGRKKLRDVFKELQNYTIDNNIVGKMRDLEEEASSQDLVIVG